MSVQRALPRFPIEVPGEPRKASPGQAHNATAEPAMPSACQSGGCGGGPPEPTPPLPSYGEVRVNGVEVAPEAIAREMQHHPAGSADAAWVAAARALAIRELLLQEARRLELEAAPDADAAGRREPEEDALVTALLEQVINPDPPTEAECRRYYEARRERFRTPDLFEVSHILIEPETDEEEAWAAARARAEALAAEVGDDPRGFAEAARAFSACPSARQDGSLGQVRRGELVAPVQAAIEALEPGGYTEQPVRSRHGWHVLRLARRIDGETLPFEAVQDKIAQMLGARSWSVAATRYVAELASRSEIEGVVVEPEPDPAAL